MHRYQILIEYEGTKFIGWQIQLKGKSVQKLIQNKLSKLLKQKIILVGAGRTDKGVHGIEQSAHFDVNDKIVDLEKFLKSLNFFLNNELISIINIKKKNSKFHARFSAKKRIYKYIIFNRKSVPSIQKNRGWHIKNTLDINLMKKGAKKLEGTNDYSTYRSSSCSAKSPIKTIDFIKIKKFRYTIEIRVKSQSFLQQQVRSMVGCLKYLAEKKWDLRKFSYAHNSKKRKFCAPPAPPFGLYLEKVIY
jgi:tRNA pseudouridine38-40 synthase